MRNWGTKKDLGPAGGVSYMSGMLDMETIKQVSTEIAKANFGPENVVRVESEPTVDSTGKEALDILIVVAPSVPDNLTGDNVVDTPVQISARLMEAGDEHLPIIGYATEEELADEVQADLTPPDPQHFFGRCYL
jgi:hypothetical protein